MSKYKNPARYRLDFIKENTFNRVWSIRMTRAKVIAGTVTVVAAGAALVWLIMAYTPMRRLLPPNLGGDLRGRYIETALRLDSLQHAARINDAYISNIVSILSDSIPEDSAMRIAAEKVLAADSLLFASDAEREFVRQYTEEERFNLSVLSPIAAEGLIFTPPMSAITSVEPTSSGVTVTGGREAAVTSVYRGTVVSLTTDSRARTTVVVQHPGDFISVYTDLAETYVQRGAKIAGAQRIGRTAADGTAGFELWHNGTPLNPGEYISL